MSKARNIAALSTVEVGATADQTKADLNAIGVSGGRKNLIINGGMQVDQRNTLGSPNTGGFIRSVDGNWFCAEGTDGAATYEQIADAPAASGLVYSQKVTVTTADSALASNQRLCNNQGVEGYDWNRLKWGTSEAKPATVQFWVKSSVTGTYGFSLRTGIGGMSYTQPYTISSANTWEYKTFTVAGPTSILGGSVSATNGTAWYLIFGLGFGAGFDTGVDNTWAAVGNGQGRAAHTNLMATNGATWQLTGFQIEVGSVATDFEHRSYGEELALCQRYYYEIGGTSGTFITMGEHHSAAQFDPFIKMPVTMRVSPTFTQVNGSNYWLIYTGGVGKNMSNAWTFWKSTPNHVSLYGTLDTNGTIGHAGRMLSNNTAAKLMFSAEL